MTTDTKEKVIEWMFQQGVSSVLLVAILTFLGYAVILLVPKHFDQIEKGYNRNAEITSAALKAIADSHDRDRQMFIDLLSGRSLTHKP